MYAFITFTPWLNKASLTTFLTNFAYPLPRYSAKNPWENTHPSSLLKVIVQIPIGSFSSNIT